MDKWVKPQNLKGIKTPCGFFLTLLHAKTP